MTKLAKLERVHSLFENHKPHDSLSLAGAQTHSENHCRTGSCDLQTIADELAPGYAALRQAAEMYADHQKRRIAIDNQIGSLQIEIVDYQWYSDRLVADEEALKKQLIQIYRKVVPASVIAWQEATPGIGPQSLARLLGHLGHPRLATPQEWARNTSIDDNEWGDAENPKRMLVPAGPPFLRTFSQLRQYCGVGAPIRRTKGMTQEEAFAGGRRDCKTQLWRMAENVVKTQYRSKPEPHALGSLGQLYMDTRAKYSGQMHTGSCPGGITSVGGRAIFVKCKVDGRYAEAGDPFQPSHVKANAYRILAKAVLAGLYDAAEESWT